jgi:hypothetical protein
MVPWRWRSSRAQWCRPCQVTVKSFPGCPAVCRREPSSPETRGTLELPLWSRIVSRADSNSNDRRKPPKTKTGRPRWWSSRRIESYLPTVHAGSLDLHLGFPAIFKPTSPSLVIAESRHSVLQISECERHPVIVSSSRLGVQRKTPPAGSRVFKNEIIY